MFTGSLVALVTPMLADGALDLPRFRTLIEWHIDQGSDGLVIVGTTGESPTVNMDEHCQLIRVAVEQAAGRVPVIAGTGGNSTAEAIELTRCAKAAGAAAGLSVAPYYNKPTQEGLYRHFKAIAESTDLPLILYNVPGRTVSDIGNETALRLAQVPGVIGIKDATGNIERGSALLKAAPASFSVYSGDDASGMVLMLLGARGVITVTGNVAPKLMHEMCVAAINGDIGGNLARARAINYQLLGLHQKLFVEANPIPVKWALAEMGQIGSGIRLPLVSLSDSYHDTLRVALKEAGCL
ncbi:MAG: 4-hydroxy-tetrahydrodipicolinate synthase [Hydrogenophilales bacterium 28-61-23]|nr:MAG: 4-hydroxy-tetrahydrodipicolinate synthase [Hydrogenophilales bacterium 28-61-23]